MAVQGKAGFKAQGISGAKARGPAAQLYKAVPQPLCVAALYVYLIAQRLAGVAGLGYPRLMPLKLYYIQRVLHGLGYSLSLCEGEHYFLALRALNGYRGVVLGYIGYGAVVALRYGQKVGKILFGIGGVYHQQEIILVELVKIRVVYGAAVFIGDYGVLCLLDIQRHYVAGKHMLQKGDPLGALDKQPAHVGNVKEPARVAGVQVLGYYAGGVLYRHFPSAEVHHIRPRRNVGVVQLSTFEFAHKISSCFDI